MNVRSLGLVNGMLYLALWGVLMAAVPSCSDKAAPAGESQPTGEMAEMGERLGEDVARVTHASDAGAGTPPVIILAESHDSRLQQIEQAIVLVRAYRDEGLRNIVLEAYLDDKPHIPFDQLRANADASVRAYVGLKHLELGNLTGGEYVAMVFDEVNLIPGENSTLYDVVFQDETPAAIIISALDLAGTDMTDADIREVNRILESFGATNDLNEEQQLMQELCVVVGRSSETAGQILQALTNPMDLSIEEELEAIEELRSDVQRSGGDRETLDAIDEFKAFLVARSDATETMLAAVPRDSDGPVAIIMGAAHREKAMEALQNVRPYVAIVGDHYEDPNDPSEMTSEEYDRRMEGLPIREGGYSQVLVDLLTSDRKHRPGNTFDYYRAEGELDTILVVALSGTGVDGGPPSAPVGHPQNWFNRPYGWEGEFWDVPSASIVWVDDDGQVVARFDDLDQTQWNEETSMPVGAAAMAFDLNFRQGDSGLTLTAKVRPSVEGEVIRESLASFRSNLADALELELIETRNRMIKDESEYVSSELREGEVYQRKPSWNTDAIVGSDNSVVRAAKFR